MRHRSAPGRAMGVLVRFAKFVAIQENKKEKRTRRNKAPCGFACLFFCLLIQSVRSLRACLLMLSARRPPPPPWRSAACGGRRRRRRARRRRPVHRPVRVGARRLLGEHVEELLGGRRNASQSFHEHQPRYGFLDPLRVVVLRPHPLPARIRLDPPLSIRVVFDPSLSSRVVERSVPKEIRHVLASVSRHPSSDILLQSIHSTQHHSAHPVLT